MHQGERGGGIQEAGERLCGVVPEEPADPELVSNRFFGPITIADIRGGAITDSRYATDTVSF